MKRLLLLFSALAGLADAVETRAQDVAYLGELRAVAFGYCPSAWAPAAGQTLTANQNQPLFALLSYRFGGSGLNFKLPDMRGLAPTGASQFTAPNNPNPYFAQSFGTTYGLPAPATQQDWTVAGSMKANLSTTVTSNTNFVATGTGEVTLTSQNLPAHTHPLRASSAGGTANAPNAALSPTFPAASKLYAASTAVPDTPMSPNAVGANTAVAPAPVPISVSAPISAFIGNVSAQVSMPQNTFEVLAASPTQAPSLSVIWCICVDYPICEYPQRPD